MVEKLHTVLEWAMLAGYGGILLSFPLGFWLQNGDIVFYAALLFTFIYGLRTFIYSIFQKEI